MCVNKCKKEVKKKKDKDFNANNQQMTFTLEWNAEHVCSLNKWALSFFLLFIFTELRVRFIESSTFVIYNIDFVNKK